MYSHLIDEIAYDRLTRAHNTIRTLYFLLSSHSENDGEHLEPGGMSALAGHILDDLRESLEGCEEIKQFSDIYTPPVAG